jgi:predicted membrane protein
MSAASDAASGNAARVLSRALALSFASAVSLMLLLDPYLLNGVSLVRVHEGLPLLMLGISAAFAYGLGFSATNPIVRALLHPALACALIGAGVGLMALS